MEYEKETKVTFKHADLNGMQIFNEGDGVICTVRDGRRYVGRIAMIGRYQENEETDPEDVICIHMPKGKTSYSGEIIKAVDIIKICRILGYDSYEYLKANEEQDRTNFISMIIGLGYGEEKAEIIYDSLKDIINTYNVPLSPFLGGAIQSSDLSMGGACQKELKEVSDKALGTLFEAFDAITDSMKKRMREYIGSQDLEQ